MSDKKQVYAKAHRVVDLLRDRQIPGPEVVNREAWYGTVRNRLRTEHWDTIITKLETEPDCTAEALAETIAEASKPAPRPTVAPITNRHACRQCGCTGGGGWLDCGNRDDFGMTTDLVPCPTCAADRHRLHAMAVKIDEGERANERLRYASAITSQRALADAERKP